MKYRLGIDIGGTKIAYGIFDENRVIVYRYKTETDALATPKELEEKIVTDTMHILDALKLGVDDLAGIAMGFPSYVNFDDGVIVFTSNMPNLHHFCARAAFEKRFPGVRVVVDNDTNIAAIAEHRYGAGRGYDHMLYTAVSTGIGSGFILNGDIYRGAYGGAGESGHMLITPDEGVMCGCDNKGCFMSNASGSMIVRHAKNALQSGRQSLLGRLVGDDFSKLTAVHIYEAFCEGDALATELIDQIGYYIGVYTYNFFIGLNLNCYVYGGGMMNIGTPLMQRIQDTFDRYNHQKDQKVYLKTAELKQDVGIIGAAELLYSIDR